jgi:hypothetical protein
MNAHTWLARPVKMAIYWFMGLMVLAMALAFATHLAALSVTVEKRALGVLIGVMVVVIGNLLPKLRPLSTRGADPSRATAAERFTGWLLVLAGTAYVALFVFLPLERARPIAAMTGLSAIVLVTLSWTRLALTRASRCAAAAKNINDESRPAVEQRKVVVALLFAFFYLFATACVAYFFDDQAWFHEYASWNLVGFCFVYAALSSRQRTRRER